MTAPEHINAALRWLRSHASIQLLYHTRSARETYILTSNEKYIQCGIIMKNMESHSNIQNDIYSAENNYEEYGKPT